MEEEFIEEIDEADGYIVIMYNIQEEKNIPKKDDRLVKIKSFQTSIPIEIETEMSRYLSKLVANRIREILGDRIENFKYEETSDYIR